MPKPKQQLPTITAGQALLILIDKHKNDDKNLLNELKKFYFLGAKNANKAMKIDTLITTESSLQEYTISKRPYDIQGSRYLVKDFGTSKSPKSTRQRAKYFGRDFPASGTLR